MWHHEFVREPGLVILKLYGTPTREGLEQTLQELEREYRSWGDKQAIAFDLSEVDTVGAAERAQVADFRKKNAGLIRSRVSRGAYIVPRALLRGALTAVTWLMPSTAEIQVFKSLESARPWLLRR